jgi:ribosomal protein S18 acetylase RimI-like enzyme
MYICVDVFPNPEHRTEETINNLANKFTQFAEFHVAYSGNETAGFIAYYCHDESKNAFVSMLMVREKFQRQGIGKAFLDRVIEDCKKLGKDRIRLEVDTDNAKGLAFYKKNGFVRECAASPKSDYYVLEL